MAPRASMPKRRALDRPSCPAIRCIASTSSRFGSGSRTEGRYVEAELPRFPFGALSFDLTLCSHLLFLYTTQLGEAFHQSAIREMCRVAREVRIFPLLALGGTPSPFVERMVEEFGGDGFDVSIDAVPYEFQRGGNQMMRLRRKESAADRNVEFKKR